MTLAKCKTCEIVKYNSSCVHSPTHLIINYDSLIYVTCSHHNMFFFIERLKLIPNNYYSTP